MVYNAPVVPVAARLASSLTLKAGRLLNLQSQHSVAVNDRNRPYEQLGNSKADPSTSYRDPDAHWLRR